MFDIVAKLTLVAVSTCWHFVLTSYPRRLRRHCGVAEVQADCSLDCAGLVAVEVVGRLDS